MNIRNKPCACGSNKKFKHCCWNPTRKIAMIEAKPIIPPLEEVKTTTPESRPRMNFPMMAMLLMGAIMGADYGGRGR